MVTLRSILYLSFMSVSIFFYSLPISIFGRVLPYRRIAGLGKQWANMNLKALERICGLGYRLQGRQNLPSGTYIVLCKHQSAWETIALRALLPLEQTWVLKRELLWTPFFGWALSAFRPIAIDRGSALRAIKKLLKEGAYWLDQGRSIVIFPEGTRVAAGQRGHYGQGGAILAHKTGYPVVPIAHNAGLFWRRRDIKKFPGRIDLVIGEPLDPKGLSAAEINRFVEEWIEGTVARLPQERS